MDSAEIESVKNPQAERLADPVPEDQGLPLPENRQAQAQRSLVADLGVFSPSLLPFRSGGERLNGFARVRTSR
jgi:hypothetical protein